MGGWGPSSLDYSRSFTVSYEVGKSVDLAYHYDDSEVGGEEKPPRPPHTIARNIAARRKKKKKNVHIIIRSLLTPRLRRMKRIRALLSELT